MTSIDIVGNGPSSYLHTKGQRPYIQCNLPSGNQQPDFYCIIDHQPIDWMALHEHDIEEPCIITDKVARACQKHGIKLDVIHTYTGTKENGFMNSGQAACLWAAPAYQDIYLWGFDSLISGITESSMDRRVTRRRSPRLHLQWQPYWQKIFSKYPNNRFLVCGKGPNELENKEIFEKNVAYHQVS